jgi:dienelactone hydrolase
VKTFRAVAAAMMAAMCAAACATSPPKPALPPLAADREGPIDFPVGDDLTLTGDLALPPGAERVGAVVLMHGCSGLPTRSVTVWQPLVLSWSYATLVVDSFGGRGLRGVCGNALRFTGAERIADAYGALARSLGYDFQVIVYPGARHGFDAVGLRHEIYLRNVDNAADCTPRLASVLGPIVNLFELISCIKKGATVGHDPEATALAQSNVRRELSTLLVTPRR